MTLEEMLQQYLAAQLEAMKAAQPEATEAAPVYVTPQQLEEATKALKESFTAAIEAVQPVERGEGAGRKGVAGTEASPEARKATDPLGYITAKATDPAADLTQEDKVLILELTKAALRQGLIA
jgi:hypothetical protein